MKLDGKVAIITGGGVGIGRATALLFVKEGAKVVVADNVISSGEETVKTIKKAGGEALFIKTDVSLEEDVKKLMKVAVNKYGKLNIVFNNAGVADTLAFTHEVKVSEWHRIININLNGVFLGMKYAIPEMLKGGGGAIVNVASLAGLVGVPQRAAYCTSKGGVIQLTKAAALEYANQNIRVNCIAPGFIWTPMQESALIDEAKRKNQSIEEAKKHATSSMPINRFGKPEEIAQAVVFLASDEASFITGVTLPVDGGYTAQ